MKILSPLPRLVLPVILLVGFFITGCGEQRPAGSTTPAATDYYRPPAPASTEPAQTAATQAPDTSLAPTATVPCADNLAFRADITIPDGTVVAPEATLDKRWEVENTGNCNWGEGYRVRLIAGPDLGAQQEQALFPARSGVRATVRIVFKAPEEPGSYRSAWQAFNPQGEPFGDPFFVEVLVQ